MLPNVVMWLANSIVPPERVSSFLTSTMGDFRLGPHEAIYAAFMLAYMPFGVRLIYASALLPEFSKLKTFLNIRMAVADVRKSDWVIAACEGAFENFQETGPFFLAAVLACLQAGVEDGIIADFATLWIFLRLAFFVVYFAMMAKNSPAIGLLRTPLWLTSVALIANMMLLAGAAHAAPPIKKGFF